MAQKHQVDVPQARVVGARERMAHVVEDAHAGRILEDRGAVAVAELPGMRAQRRDLHVLARGRKGGAYQGEYRARGRKAFHVRSSC